MGNPYAYVVEGTAEVAGREGVKVDCVVDMGVVGFRRLAQRDIDFPGVEFRFMRVDQYAVGRPSIYRLKVKGGKTSYYCAGIQNVLMAIVKRDAADEQKWRGIVENDEDKPQT